MTNSKPTTKELLLISAGELFADNGFEGVSTRMIADKAGVKLSAIHYHFGSKENLYTEACLFAHSQGQTTTFEDVCNENPNLLSTPEGQAEIVRTTVFRTFHNHFRPDRPDWESKIILREIAAPTATMTVLAEKVFKPDTQSAERFYKITNPEATNMEAAAWADMLYSKLALYCMAKETILTIRGEDALSPEFFRVAATKLARAMCLEAGLPLPKDLQPQAQSKSVSSTEI